MKTMSIAVATTAAVFLALDFVWLTTMADILYRPALGDLLAPEFRLGPAVLFYLIYVAGLAFFAIRPGLAAGSPVVALLNGAAFGFVAYATYDLTNQATLRIWPSFLTISDLAWGTSVSAVSAAAGVLVARRLDR